MDDYENDEEFVRNNPYTEDDKEILNKMKKIPKEATEFNEKLTFTFCSREMWGAWPPDPKMTMRKVIFPVKNVRFVDTGTDECYTPYECFRVLQNLQMDHMRKENLPDIKYNFMVGADGTIYEGRGWRNDADRPPQFDHLQGNCIDIALIGNLNDSKQDDGIDPFPRLKCERRAYDWMLYGMDNNYVTEDYPNHSEMRNQFPTLKQEQHGFNWAYHGSDRHNFVVKKFEVIHDMLPNKFDPLYFM